MIPAFLAGRNHGSFLNDTELESRHGPVIVPRSEHNVSRANISPNALKVLYRLKSAGFEAFLVGGGVRDLLLDRHPKDFDVVTNADPDQIHDLFRNCRLIGRRFRLAHVRFGRDIVEVATFRASGAEADDDERAHSDSGRILRDNVYGTIDEDVWRRDFTVNALYYNITDFSIWDYINGVADVRARTLRLIGDPEKRYREDPVRMLRAMRFAAKLDFTLAPETAAPIASLGRLFKDVPSARLVRRALEAVSERPRRAQLRSAACSTIYCAICFAIRRRSSKRPIATRSSTSSAAGSRTPTSAFAKTSPSRRCSCTRCSCGSRSRRSRAGSKARAGTTVKRCSKRASASSRRSRRRFRAASARR